MSTLTDVLRELEDDTARMLHVKRARCAALLRQQSADIQRLTGERQVLAGWIAEALATLSTFDEEVPFMDCAEDGGAAFREFQARGEALVKAVLS